MKKMYQKLILLLSFFILPNIIWAQGIVDSEDPKYATGSYQLNDLIVLLINISEWILAISGAAALLAFIIGGVMFLMSGGSQDKITAGKGWLKGAIIGLVIVFTSYMIINFVMINIFDYEKTGNFGSWSVVGDE